MHWALKESGVEYDVVQAMDVNTSANAIYQHNFPDVNVCASSITKLTLNQLAKWAPNTILMSPPCQPFTRVGKKQDCQDPRTESFLHLLGLLQQLEDKPEYILVENVKGFEVSETRKLLLDTLKECDYTFQEFLLTPLQFGVPNCRMRYYLIAKLRPLEFTFKTSEKILEMVPEEVMPWLRFTLPEKSDFPATAADSSNITECCNCSASADAPTSSCPASSNQNQSCACSCGLNDRSRQNESKDRDRTSADCDSGSTQNTCGCPGGGGESKQDSCEHCGSEGVNISSGSCQPKTTTCAFNSEAENPPPHGIVSKSETENHTLHKGKSDDRNCLTIAEAGRNMRHCEEEDMLVCEDGTRLEEYLEVKDEEYLQRFLLSDKDLRMFVVMDVVHPSFKKSSCFTKRYGHYVEGAGSLVMMTDDAKIVKEASEFKSWAVEHKNRQQWGEAELSVLRRLKLRYFTPREVANLLCFPPQFVFPEELNTIQCHRVLGNSLNVHVVSVLIRLTLLEPGVI
ncbi:tRNA (cytosine(38)-C(5))-methyltransferase-like [Littorina saxatilis]